MWPAKCLFETPVLMPHLMMNFEVMAVSNRPAADRPDAAIGHWQPLGCSTVWMAD